ncbi:helix-turn-helix domain-containing protein [Mucilaginibacter jinjuensis]|uniref:Helix-turn-helix domain-containing protein n=1 Tax=Mucilaginibacter jinjuensis TaxID=1176721 RepID=A0ABY7T9S4_9SPHI|nr:helix-turn-helix domain-containing protein [Mucilaginibacter jinjuensis]WCT12954.1 helix-turn-helix domain-containing protein [Mucilaginibacter jinjuensis]
MEIAGAANIGDIFISCKKEKHYSREVILPRPALVRVYAGEMRIASADRVFTFYAGDTILLPRNQLGRLSKLPLNGEPFKSISIVFSREKLQQYYSTHQINVVQENIPKLKVLPEHPLLDSLFDSLLPYFKLADVLPPDIAVFKVEEAIRVLRAVDENVDSMLGQFEEPGKIDLVDFMDKNYMFNLSLEKFGYLTGRSLTTFKKDFKKAFKITPGKWLTQKRLQLAHYQIVEKNRKPSEVYFDVGFENLSHFSFAFKKQFGYNPSALGY